MRLHHRVCFALAIGCIAALLSACGGAAQQVAVPAAIAPLGIAQHRTFRYTGAEQSFKVPPGVTSISVVARGGGGANETGHHSLRRAQGGRVHAIIPVTPGEKLFIFVGGGGSGSTGGFNGGGSGGAPGKYGHDAFGGGGASDVREAGDRLSDRIVVAAGGGGAGGVTARYYFLQGAGGAGGGLTGGSGGGFPSQHGPTGGSGGTQTGGGNGGIGGRFYYWGNDGADGTLGTGGAGGTGTTSGFPGGAGGGGGGGGYYGGGGGGAGSPVFTSIAYASDGGGGGGGSSYVEPRATHFKMWTGWKDATGDGLVVLSWGSP
ncbi:MAG TPA: glycine-rich protein [Candidatus Baltobacteraceae bacterium]|nr:glycine-rich protein [Candidatus Baltobacteraceae bacterium]